MRHQMTRRVWVEGVLAAGALFAANARADQSAPLDPDAPDAKALGFQADASKVTVEANPTFKPGQQCGSCSQFKPLDGNATGACAIFGGRRVPTAAWCRVWTARSA